MRPRVFTIVVLVAALAGFIFAAFSTHDFVVHLDRQVHGIHCSFLPGITTPDVSGASGCHTTLMSPYSSVLRETVWGGVPVALPGMSVFAFLAFWATLLILRRRQEDASAVAFLVAAAAVPVITSGVFGYLSLVTLDAACKMCIGIYAASGLAFIGALGLLFQARRAAGSAPSDPRGAPAPLRLGPLAGAFGVGVLFVALPVGAYAAAAPDFSSYVGTCGELLEPAGEDVLVAIGPQQRSIEVVEVLDPLCPACRGFEQRFDAQEASNRVRRKILLFPMDNTCNWMVDSAMHPGACAVSEAILCAEGREEEVIDWAFAEQRAIREAAAEDPDAAARLVSQRFPELADCVGSPAVRARLNLALRWAVTNQMPVLTPQVYVDGVRMCDEDTDLGMDWALARLIERAETGGPRTAPPQAQPVEGGDEPPPTAARPPVASAGGRPTIQLRPHTEPAPSAAGELPAEEDPLGDAEGEAGAGGEGEPGDSGETTEGGEAPPGETESGEGGEAEGTPAATEEGGAGAGGDTPAEVAPPPAPPPPAAPAPAAPEGPGEEGSQ